MYINLTVQRRKIVAERTIEKNYRKILDKQQNSTTISKEKGNNFNCFLFYS